MPEIAYGNRRIYYESHGEGYPLVLIRGLGSNADHWYAQVPELSGHYRVITFTPLSYTIASYCIYLFYIKVINMMFITRIGHRVRRASLFIS
jgi:pimeloyl-ACP methyl ester carboxylesterase